MKRILIFVIPQFVFGAWINITSDIEGPKAYVGSKEYVQLSPNTPVRINVKKGMNIRWIIESDSGGKLWYVNSKTGHRAEFRFDKGKNDIRMHLYRGSYEFYSTVEVMAKIMKYVRRKWKPIQPEGGGYPIILMTGDRKYTYYEVNKSIYVKLKGPTRLYIFFRAFINKTEHPKAKVKIYEGKRLIKTSIKRLKASRKSRFMSKGDTIVASVPLKVFIDVPKGLHRYRIVVSGAKGAIKFYIDKKSRRRGLGSNYHYTDVASLNMLPDRISNVKRTRKIKRHNLRIRLNLEGSFSDNVYHYSKPQIDTYALQLKTYRYPNVRSIGDGITSVGASLYYKYRFRRRAYLGAYLDGKAKIYMQNSGLNRFIIKAGFKGGYRKFISEIYYLYIPLRNIRPTYTGNPKEYRMLSFRYDRLNISTSYNFKRANIKVIYSFGHYDFKPPFEAYTSTFHRIGINMKLKDKIAHIGGGVSYGIVRDASITDDVDWSHNLIALNLNSEFRGGMLRPFVSLTGALRTYTTNNPLDKRYQRKDEEVKISVGVRIVKGNLKPYLLYTHARRSTNSPYSAINIFKDYTENLVSVGFITNLSAL